MDQRDLEGAQRLMEQQSQTRWQPLFGAVDALVPSAHKEICRPIGASPYYWTVSESEYAMTA